jgi:hypothetical protein
VTKQKIIERAAPIINEFKSLLERWGFEIEPLYESTLLDFAWAIKWRGALVRPLQIYIWERQDKHKQSKIYSVHLVSDEKVDYNEATDDDLQDRGDKQRKNWLHYFRKSLERLTEYLVLAAARMQAIDEVKVHIRKSGKPLYIEIGDHRYALLFRADKTTWTWAIRRWQTTPPFGWAKADNIRGRHEENPILILSRIIKGLYLSAL